MFDFSFGELVVCLLVALVVLGPEKLHGLIQGVGRFVGRARSYLRALSMELERETELGELRRQVDETKRMFRQQAEEFGNAVKSVQHNADGAADSQDLDPSRQEPSSLDPLNTMDPANAAKARGHARENTPEVPPALSRARVEDPEASKSEAQGQNHRG